jgi:hypothetical protein
LLEAQRRVVFEPPPAVRLLAGVQDELGMDLLIRDEFRVDRCVGEGRIDQLVHLTLEFLLLLVSLGGLD